MIDVDVVGSPGWWLERCHRKLGSRQQRLKLLFDRYESKPAEPEWLLKAPDAAQNFYRSARTNFALMVVMAPYRRLRVTSIGTASDANEVGDHVAWAAWKSAGMLTAARDIHRKALIAGDAYAIMGVDDSGPYATAEDPRQVVTIHDPVRQSTIRAGAKFFRDDDEGVDYGYLYLPGRRFVARADSGTVTFRERGDRVSVAFSPRTWSWDETKGGAEGEAYAKDGSLDSWVPIVRYRNDEGVGEFERHEDILNRIDHIILQGMVVATMQAFRQRAIRIDDEDMPENDPETGEPINYDEVFSADPGTLWKLPRTAELWESGQVDLNGIMSMAEKEMQRISAVTFTPLSMFNSDAVNQSAAGADLVKEGLTDKVEGMQDSFTHPHALVASGLLHLAGETERADINNIRIGWAPATRYSLMEKAQAATAGKASDVPWRTRLRELWQFTPEQIEQAETERMDDAVLYPESVTAAPNAAADPALLQSAADEAVNAIPGGDGADQVGA